MVVPFKRILTYVRKNIKPSIITTAPNDSIIMSDEKNETEKENYKEDERE